MENVMPNNSIVETKTFHLSTKSSAGTILNENPNYKSKIRFNIPDAIVRDETIDFIQFSIPYAVIPNSFYTINESNNLLVIRIYSTPPTSTYATYKYTFPVGNYNATTFMNTFNNVVGLPFSISLNSNNNNFTITHTTYEFAFDELSTIDYILGFSDTVYSVSKSLTMPRVCNFLPLPRIIIRSPDLAHSYLEGTTDAILSIPNNAKPNGQIVYNTLGSIKNIFKLDILNSFVVSITDDEGNLINFNGVSSFFTFQFDIHRKYIEKPIAFNKILDLVNTGHGSRPI